MNTLFDALCSSWMISLPALAVIVLLMAKLLYTPFFKNEKSNSVFRVLVMILVPGSTVLFIYLAGSVYGFGYVDKFIANTNSNKWICLVSEGTFRMHMKGGGKTVGNRLYLLDSKTGDKIYRTVIGDFSKVIRLQGDTLLYQSGHSAFVLYNVRKNMPVATLDAETLPVQLKEFSMGVEDCSYDKETRSIKASAKDGKIYYIDPFSMKAQATNPVPDKAGKKLRFESQFIQLDSIHSISLKNKDSDDKLLQLVDKGGKAVTSEGDFLYAEFVANATKLNRFVVLSYETTDKSNFILTCISHDYKVLWKIKQSELGASDFFSKKMEAGKYANNPTIDFPKVLDESLIFTIQGFVFSVDLNTGKVNWKTRL
jgi:hypothetical protein